MSENNIGLTNKNVSMVLELIKEKRKEKGIKQSEMSEKVGLSQTAYSQLENGKHEMRVSTLFKIFDVLGVENFLKEKEKVNDLVSLDKDNAEKLVKAVVNSSSELSKVNEDISEMKDMLKVIFNILKTNE